MAQMQHLHVTIPRLGFPVNFDVSEGNALFPDLHAPAVSALPAEVVYLLSTIYSPTLYPGKSKMSRPFKVRRIS